MRHRSPTFRFLAVHSLVAGLALAGIAPHVMACSPAGGETMSRADSARTAESAAPTCCCGADKGRCGMTGCCGVTTPRRESQAPASGHVKSVPLKLLGVGASELHGPCVADNDCSPGVGIDSPAVAGPPSTLQARHIRLQV